MRKERNGAHAKWLYLAHKLHYLRYGRQDMKSKKKKITALKQVEWRRNAKLCDHARHAEGGKRILCNGWTDCCFVDEEPEEEL